MKRFNHQAGFTIIEVIVSIIILGIVSSLVVSVINRTVLNYHNLSERDKLSTAARIAIERIAREVRLALPNSVCTYNGANCQSDTNKVYFIKTVDAGQYQDQTGTYTDPTVLKSPLPITPNSASEFDIISNGSSSVTAGQWVTVYNINNTNIYTPGTHRKQISSVSSKDPDPATPNDDITVLHFGTPVSFPLNSPNRRFQITENKVTIFYLNTTDSNLYLATTENLLAPDDNTDPTYNSFLLLENVTNLTFSYQAGSQHRSGLLRIDMTVESADHESIQLIHEVHVANVP